MERRRLGASSPKGKAVPLSGAEALADRDLVRRAQNYEPEALGRLYELYYPKVYSYALLHLGNVHEAEDLTSGVLLRVLESLGRYQERGAPFAAWVFRIARNSIIDHQRRRIRHPHQELSDSLPHGDELPHTLAERSADHQQVRAALACLTDDQRQVITLKFAQEMDNATIAQVLGKTEGAVKALQHRALVSLRKALAAEID